METNKKICPKCRMSFTAPPAISRMDGKTPICPDCGTREALVMVGITDEEQEEIMAAIHGSTQK